MFLKKIIYWGAGFVCGILIFIIGWFIDNDYSFYTNGPERRISLETHNNLIDIYNACRFHWMETDPTNTCNVDTDPLTAYGYFQPSNFLIWGESGTASNFSIKGKLRRSERVFKLEHKVAIRELEDNELKSALAELNKLEHDNQTP